MNDYIPIIGLEIHIELKTKSKMFCQCRADYFGREPNTNICPVCLGLPGALPVPNKKAIEWTILIGKALNCQINKISKFDRKHYFYPDLPKGYQISQYDEPIATKGWLGIKYQISNIKYQKSKIKNTNQISKRFRIRRVHLEEDTGKLIHIGSDTLVDFNRSGVPLVEIVTEPDFNNADEVKIFLEELHTIIRYLDVSDADMEKGSMRMEPNISIKLKDQRSKIKDKLPNYKVEVKNINSFRFVKQAIEYEIKRQIEILEKGETPKQETRGFDEKKAVTYSQRSKEEAHDYRYFPEPDIPPLKFSQEYLDSIKVPVLPQEKMNYFINKLKLKPQDAYILTRNIKLSQYYEKVISNIKYLSADRQDQISNISARGGFAFDRKNQKYEQLIANLIINKKISSSLSVDDFVKKALEFLIPKQTDEKLLEKIILQVIEKNKKAVEDYKKGKENALMFLVGQVMKEMKGKTDAKIVIEKIKKKI